MAKDSGIFNNKLEGWLSARGFNNIETYDENGDPVTYKSGSQIPDSMQFKFVYEKDGDKFGEILVASDSRKVTLFFNNAVVDAGKKGVDTGWPEFVADLKNWVLRNGGTGFKVKNMGEYGLEMKKRRVSMEESRLYEGYYGNKHTSYTNGDPQVKLVIKHNKALDEGDKRYHYIDKIFIENSIGERVLVPSKKPFVGRAFARHLAEGGIYNDERWNHIAEVASDLDKLGGFIRATKVGQFNEGAGAIVSGALQHYTTMRESIKKIGSSRGYNQYFEGWKPTVLAEESDSNLGELFASNRIDPRIERALPVLQKIGLRVSEISEASEFERWADSITENLTPEDNKKVEDLAKILNSSDPLPLGPNAMNAKGVLDPLLDDGSDREELFTELEELSYMPDNDARPAIGVWLQKHAADGGDFYVSVVDKLNEPPGDSTPEKIAPKAKPEPVQQQPAAVPAIPGLPGGPAPLEEKKSAPPKQRNYVAKHAQRSGAGKHGGSGYQRHEKHRKPLGEEGLDEALSRIMKLSGL